MSAYVTQAQVETNIPPDYLRQACDDDGDGVADAGVLAAILEQASKDADAPLAAQYDTPFAVVPALVAKAARVFACELVYARRGAHGDANPWTKQADALRTQLERIGQGKEPLDAAQPGNAGSVAIVTEPSRLARPGGALFN